MKMSEITPELRRQFLHHVYGKIKENMTGSNTNKVLNDKPQMKFFVGTLCSQSPSKNLANIKTKVAPVRMGIEFLLRKSELKKATLTIQPSASIFYRINPSYEEQLEATLTETQLSKEELQAKIKEQCELAKQGKEDCKLGPKPLVVFTKHRIKSITALCKLSDIIKDSLDCEHEFKSEAKEMIDDAYAAFKADDEKYWHRSKREEVDAIIPLSSLVNPDVFSDYWTNWASTQAEPVWEFKISIIINDFNEEMAKISVLMENTSKAHENDYVDNFLFDTNLRVKVDGAKIQDFEIDYLKDYYRYNGLIGASGINCEAIKNESDNSVHTEHVPCFEQMRIKTREGIKPLFKELASDNAISLLKAIANSMKEYLDEKYIKEYQHREKNKEFTDQGKIRFKDDIETFRNEIKRFEYGISILENTKDYPLALKAFKLMNQTFANAGQSKANDKPFYSWRLFQIIFIVMNIPDVVSTEYDNVHSTIDTVEVLYFPTGGGKTETYLGLSIYTLFFDRFRGKNFGTSAMLKFPLRLLSLQQIQRIANVLAQAELIRRNNPETNTKNSEPFSLGYYVGDRNTPNKLVSKFEEIDRLGPIIEERQKILKGERQLKDETLEGRKYLILSKCPFCGSDKIMIDADRDRIRLIHKCMSCNEGELPIYVSDIEVYRYIPSLIISTLDKIAICGLQKNFRNIFGQVTHKCPLHGYSNTPECTEKWQCKVDKTKILPVKPYDPVPTLQIQDELHLVRESLGTFNAHYESFLENYEKELTKSSGRKRGVKILTATATISNYEMQTEHLYCKDAVQFPSQGPSIHESFYTKVDDQDLNRLIVGIMPHYKTMIFSIIDILQAYHALIENYRTSPNELIQEMNLSLTEQEVTDMLEDYRIMLSYHLAKNDGDSVANSIRSMTNRFLRENRLAEIRPRSMTGDISFDEVRVTLDEIEHPDNSKTRINLIIATSMISHGVDLDKLNLMVFMGMPRNTAEYIQASSRVGRKFPGLVFVLFNPTRERDQSYFKFFSKFHEYRDLLIEAVPINRWAKFSINRTLPGIFTASLLNYFDIRSSVTLGKSINMSRNFEAALRQNLISEDKIKDFIERCYKLDKERLGLGIQFKQMIDEKISEYVHDISQNLGNEFITAPMAQKPMRSLRDVDIPIEINISPEGGMVLRNITAARTTSYVEDEEDDSEGED
jgi:hypothetical protein